MTNQLQSLFANMGKGTLHRLGELQTLAFLQLKTTPRRQRLAVEQCTEVRPRQR